MEIERKFLVGNDWPRDAGEPVEILQTYFHEDRGRSGRVRKVRDRTWTRFTLTAKSPGSSPIERNEVEFDIDEELYDALVAASHYESIHKLRFETWHDEWELTIDYFLGNLAGLMLAEIEFATLEEAESFDPSLVPWLGQEVSDNWAYLNSELARSQQVPAPS